MIAAVSRDESVLVGGISASRWTRKDTVSVEPIGYLTPAGEWSRLPCSTDTEDTVAARNNCLKFARGYLIKAHVYTVISSDGNGAVVHAAPTTLNACYGYTGKATYSGAVIRTFAIAASSAEFFVQSVPPSPLSYGESAVARKALKAFVPEKLDTTQELHIFALRLEGHDMIVVQRVFSDVVEKPGRYQLVFGIGTLGGGKFHTLHWKQNTGDDQETLLGTIALNNGRQFLITVVNGSEWQFFRVYGIRSGRLALIYTGGGSSC